MSNLPDGVTQQMIDDHFRWDEECEEDDEIVQPNEEPENEIEHEPLKGL